MIRRSSILSCVLCLVMAVYLCFALKATARMARTDTFGTCRINVVDSLGARFVTPLEVSQEAGDLMQWIADTPHGALDLADLEAKLRACDKIERVNVCVLNTGALAIDVVPMTPVARVFDAGSSYYINAEGKRISADPRYHVDVPVVVGHFDSIRPPQRLLPLLEYIASHPAVDALVSTVKQDAHGDIILVPTIRGHVVNFGDTADVADKFERLRTMYRTVLPVRGWETYDTLAVKWRGRVVATRRDKALGASQLARVIEDFDDIDDHDTMITPLHTGSATPAKAASPHK